MLYLQTKRSVPIKRVILFFLIVTVVTNCLGQTTYYSNSSTTDFNQLSGWGINADGSGANPSSFGSAIRLVVNSGHAKNTSAVASVNRLTISSGATVTANHAITLTGTSPQFNINNLGLYIHNNTGVLSSTIFAGTETFNTTSTFQINNWQSSSITLISNLSTTGGYYYGNLIINWTGNTGAWQQNLSGTVNLTANNLTINSTGNASGVLLLTGRNSFVLNILGNLNVNAGTIEYGSTNGSLADGVISISGNFSQTAGIIQRGATNAVVPYIRAVGTGTSIWTITGGTRHLIYSYEIVSGKTVQLGANLNLGTGFASSYLVNIASGATLDAQSYLISYGSSGAQLANFGTIKTSNTNGLFGAANTTIVNTPITLVYGVGPDCTVEYYATGSQTVTASTIYENVIISGTGTKQLQNNSTINKALTFSTVGTGINKLDIASNTITISSTGSIANAGNDRYIITVPTTSSNGRLRQNDISNTNRNVFPIGTASHYLPLTFQGLTTTTSDFSVNVFNGTTTNGSPTGTPFSTRVNQVDAIWWIDRLDGTADAHIQVDWVQDSPLEGSVFKVIPDNKITILRYFNLSNWQSAVSNILGNNSSNRANSTTTKISNWGTAGTGLPYLVSNMDVLTADINLFSAKSNSQGNLLNWQLTNYSEVETFEIERSKNGIQFSMIGNVRAEQTEKYSFTDATHLAGINYYRLKIKHHNGEITYSKVVMVNNGDIKGYKIIGNPVQTTLQLIHPALNENTTYRVINSNGLVVLTGRIEKQQMQSSIQVVQLNSGYYYLQLNDSSGALATLPFIK